jgi:hypothetical protein
MLNGAHAARLLAKTAKLEAVRKLNAQVCYMSFAVFCALVRHRPDK